MADEKDVKKEVETEKVETEEKAKVDEKPTEKVEEKGEETKSTEKKEEKVEETKEEPKEPTEETSKEEVVEEAEPVGNGIRLEDVATKDYVAERIDALKAMFEAVVKENQDLKEKFAKENGDLKEKLSFMEKKYEDSDFGDLSRQGVMAKDKDANSTFDEYSKKFM